MEPYPQPGSILAGRYRLIRVIGEGGMGVVLEAENIGTERRVAVKWLHASIAKNPEATKRLIREATLTCRVRHPNVVDVYDVVHENDAVFLVMELLDGEPLEEVMRRGGMPLHQLVSMMLPAMRGVAEAHRLGVIHRDIHPANIFFARQAHDQKPIAKVLDFGISKLGGVDTPSLTQSGTTLGTPLYMSYEQLCSARDVDARTDVYSFGVVLYEALTGRPPFEAESFAELAVKIATGTPVPPKQLQPELPTSLERIILWAMARDRDQRIPTLEAFIRELEPFASEHAFRAHMTQSECALPSVVPRAERASDLPRADRPSERPAARSEPPPVAPLPSTPPSAQRKVDSQGQVMTPLARSMLPPAPGTPAQNRRRSVMVAMLCAVLLLTGLTVFGLRARSSQLASVPQPQSPAALPPAGVVAEPAPVPAASTDKPLTPAPRVEPLPVAPTPATAVQQTSAPVAEKSALAAPAEQLPVVRAAVVAKPTGELASKPTREKVATGMPTGPNKKPVAGRSQDDYRAGPVRHEDF